MRSGCQPPKAISRSRSSATGAKSISSRTISGGCRSAGRPRSAAAAQAQTFAQYSTLPRSAGLLTTREREVARLVARGLTNRQIAEALVVTEKTAANHVQHVLDKLEVHSRNQLAARAAEFGLV